MRLIGTFVLLFCFQWAVWANNIRIDSLQWEADQVSSGQPKLTLKFLVTWDNSWRDDYNYDAAYVFFKFKKKEKDTRTREEWHHLFLGSDGHNLLGENGKNYDYWLCPLSSGGTEFNAGVYIFRKQSGVYERDSVWMEVSWDVTKQQVNDQLTTDDIRNGDVLIAGHALEMVYVPRGAYRIGDGVCRKGFRKLFFPIEGENDIVNSTYKAESSDTAAGTTPVGASDRVNDNSGGIASTWKGKSGASSWWWQIDFGVGQTRRVTYFGINGQGNLPTYFKLEGTIDPSRPDWKLLWRGPGHGYWNTGGDAYPVEKAIKIHPDTVGAYRAYRITIEGMTSGEPVIKSVGMTERNLEALVDYSVLIDSPLTDMDSLKHLGAPDGDNWGSGRVEKAFPNGYRGFYAMKYELSQDQYARFLNKLTYRQQNALLGGRLDELQEGDYIFGAPDRPSCRNGIMLLTKIAGMPAVFGCRLNGLDNEEGGGGDIACNYLSFSDMLAYADWACLRPLSEMEYEKMCRPLYPEVPVKGSYPWGTTTLPVLDGGISHSGYSDEKGGKGYANWGGKYEGPLRVGSFAGIASSLEKSGGGFWGCMDLSGNLAEMYYNVNGRGLMLIEEKGDGISPTAHNTSHGNGSLNADGAYDGAQRADLWSKDPNHLALRGGSFASASEADLKTSDRYWFRGGVASFTSRDSTVGVRLGRSAPEYPELTSFLIMENKETSRSSNVGDVMYMNTYKIKGNKPRNEQGGAYTYIWYMAENGGEWKVLEGENNQHLYFRKYVGDTLAERLSQFTNFKRKVITPFADSETSSLYMATIYNSRFDPFLNEPIEYFTYTGPTHTVKCNWQASIPREWGIEGEHGTIQIDPRTGVLSGLDNTICNITVTLKCDWNPGVVYKKQVKETTRRLNYKGSYYSLTLLKGSYTITCVGASGGGLQTQSRGSHAGLGGESKGTIDLAASLPLFVYVGGQGGSPGGGWNGGGNGYTTGYGGGGATDIRLEVPGNVRKSLYSRIMVAGGGGGPDNNSGENIGGADDGSGGAGGGLQGGAARLEGGIVNRGYYRASAVNGGGCGMGGTQQQGYDLGQGENATYPTDTGGGGGGFWGGYVTNHNNGGAGGGSGFISGMPGCRAVNTSGADTGLPQHYSGYVFRNASMRSGVCSGSGYVTIQVL